MNIIEIHGTKTIFGGASVHTGMLVNHFALKGDKVVLVYQKGNIYLGNCKFGANAIVTEYDLSSLWKLPFNIVNIMKLAREYKIDIIHSHHRNADFITGIVKMLTPTLVAVSTVHGNISTNEKKIKYKMLKAVTKCLLEKVFDEVIFISEFTKEINRMYIKKFRKSKVIYNGSSRLDVTLDSAIIREKLGIDISDFVVTLVSSLEGVKRPLLFVAIAEQLKRYNGICFLVVGDGVMRREMEDKSKKNELKMIFVGIRQDVGNYINASNVVVSTAINEGFGRTLTEAMMLAKPVIAFDGSGPSEIISHGVNGFLIKNDDVDEFSMSILNIYKDNKLERYLASNSAKIAEKRFSDTVFCSNYEKEFKLLIQELQL